MRIIPHQGKALGEVRQVRFLKAFERPAEHARIVSFGRCNYRCPHCMRDAQFVDENGDVLASTEVDDQLVFDQIVDAMNAGERIRLSGGDPCMFPNESAAIAKLCRSMGKRISVCHNGSNPRYISKIAADIEYAAIDLKAVNAKDYALRAGLSERVAAQVMPNFVKVCDQVLSQSHALLDARTCMFDTTSYTELTEFAEKISSLPCTDRVFWTIRQYLPVANLDWKPMPQEILFGMIEDVSKQFPWLRIGCRLAWRGGQFPYWKSGEVSEL